MWKSPAVSGSIKRICAAAPAWKFSESREVLSAYEMGAPAMRSPMADTSATEMGLQYVYSTTYKYYTYCNV
jgi:hypothetical protein